MEIKKQMDLQDRGNDIFTKHPRPDIRVGVLFLKRKRAGFVPEWGEYIENQVNEQLKTSIFDIFIPKQKIVDIITLRKALEECNNNGCQVLIAVQPTVSDARMSPVLGQSSKAPIVFWATPEKQEGEMISACSLVGAHNFMANLSQSGHPFEFLYGMPGEDSTIKDFDKAVYRSYAYSVINGGNAGIVGYHAPGFIDMHVDSVSMRSNLNTELFHISTQEFIDGVHAVSNDDAKNDLEKFKKLGIKKDEDIREDDLLLASKYYLYIKELMDTMPLDALGSRDWPELSANWPYLALARLTSEGYSVACEGDTDGALSCLAGYASGCGVCYLSDWLEHDEHHVTLWHGGGAPLQLCQGPDSNIPPKISRHFNSNTPAVVDATLKSGMPITMFRLWHFNGKYLFTAIEGETTEPKRHLKGTNGTGRFDSVNINDYFLRMVRLGFPHHPVIAEGHVKSHLYSLMANLKVECVD